MFRQEILNSYNALGYDGEVVKVDNGETSAQLPSPTAEEMIITTPQIPA